jgi:archaemetzincin
MKLISVIFVLLSYKNEVPKQSIVDSVQKFYNFKIDIVKDEIPEACYNSKHKRYNANKILDYLSTKYPNKKVIALTSYDIYTVAHGSDHWGIFGLGSLTKNVCVTSTYRLKSKNLNKRVLSVVLHEVGHTYELEHCNDKLCLMNAGDHTAKGLDKNSMQLCKHCKSLIK